MWKCHWSETILFALYPERLENIHSWSYLKTNYSRVLNTSVLSFLGQSVVIFSWAKNDPFHLTWISMIIAQDWMKVCSRSHLTQLWHSRLNEKKVQKTQNELHLSNVNNTGDRVVHDFIRVGFTRICMWRRFSKIILDVHLIIYSWISQTK